MILIKEIEQKQEEKPKLKKFISHFTIPVTKAKELTSYSKSYPATKEFLCLESDKDFKITRIRTAVDNLRPKIITTISKAPDAMSYKMRLGTISGIILIVLVLMNLFGISSIALKKDASYYPFFIFTLLIFLYFLHGETKLTEKAIRESFVKIVKA